MLPIYFTLSDDTKVKIMPDSEAHANGHLVLTYTYHIYDDLPGSAHHFSQREMNELHLEEKHDSNYLGYVKFDLPGKLFTYYPNIHHELKTGMIEEVIAEITRYRETPGYGRSEPLK